MHNGNAFAGVWGDSLMVRTGPGVYDPTIEEPHVREFGIAGTPMKGWVVVGPDGIEDDSALQEWLRRAMDLVNRLVFSLGYGSHRKECLVTSKCGPVASTGQTTIRSHQGTMKVPGILNCQRPLQIRAQMPSTRRYQSDPTS